MIHVFCFFHLHSLNSPTVGQLKLSHRASLKSTPPWGIIYLL
nr:MAG TPA: hypothetical protein [Caudoviricetes sp.]